ncbi:MAG: hypothetical protein V3U80_06170 [Flavobacteriaceae bacterium]
MLQKIYEMYDSISTNKKKELCRLVADTLNFSSNAVYNNMFTGMLRNIPEKHQEKIYNVLVDYTKNH